MKNIIKLVSIFIIGSLIFIACNNDADRDWTTPEASFKLYDTSLSSDNVLYKTMENNPFTLLWESTGSGDYTVVLSTSEDFTNKVELFTTSENQYNTTIGDLNTKLLQAGYSPYASQKAYIRIEKGSEVSNTISFGVTTYPIDGPIITSPTAGSPLVLDATNEDTTATTITWDDYTSYGVDVKYLVEIATKGSTSFASIGEVTNTKSLPVTNANLNTALLNTGATTGQANDIDVRITATTISTGGTITITSDVVTFAVTPYETMSYLYAPGAYQDWSVDTANTLVSTASDGNYIGFINFTDASKLTFKVTPARNWDNSYGTNDNVHIIYNGGDNLAATTTGYQKLTVNTNDLTFSLSAYSMGLVGDATTNGWDGPDVIMTWDDANLSWTATTTLTVGSLKFRVNNDWSENYGGSNGNASSGGDNIAISEAGTYKISFNPFKLTYTIIKQ